MQVFTNYYSSPAGWIKLQSNGQQITFINFEEERGTEDDTDSILQLCSQQLHEYFEGKRNSFSVPIEQAGTAFQQNVWKHLMEIPFGKTVSYLQLSKQIGDVKAIRAIASANGKNKLAVIVPCHRVIGSDASLVGYAGGLQRKKWLLAHEATHALGVQTFNF